MREPESGEATSLRISVIGGASTVIAQLDDLRTMSLALRNAASHTSGLSQSVARVHANLHGQGDALSPFTARACDGEAAALQLSLAQAARSADLLASTMDATVATYVLAEQTAAARFGPRHEVSLRHTFSELQDAETQSDAAADAIALLDSVLPGSFEDVASALSRLSDRMYDPPAPAHTALAFGPGQAEAPQAAFSVATAMGQVEAMYANDVETSHIQVQRVVDAKTGQGHWVAMLPGTASWGPHHNGVLNGADNLGPLAGDTGEAEKAVSFALEDAMRREGVLDKHEPVMLVGHSQGGIVMTDLARHAAGSALNVTRVVTYGSPVGRMKVPDKVRTLNIENSRDLVPKLDGRATGDGDGRRTRVVIDDSDSILADDGSKDVLQAHRPDRYRTDYQVAVQRERNDPESAITQFERDSAVFFAGTARTYQYDAARNRPHHPRRDLRPDAGSAEDKSALRPKAQVNPSTGGYVVTGP